MRTRFGISRCCCAFTVAAIRASVNRFNTSNHLRAYDSSGTLRWQQSGLFWTVKQNRIGGDLFISGKLSESQSGTIDAGMRRVNPITGEIVWRASAASTTSGEVRAWCNASETNCGFVSVNTAFGRGYGPRPNDDYYYAVLADYVNAADGIATGAHIDFRDYSVRMMDMATDDSGHVVFVGETNGRRARIHWYDINGTVPIAETAIASHVPGQNNMAETCAYDSQAGRFYVGDRWGVGYVESVGGALQGYRTGCTASPDGPITFNVVKALRVNDNGDVFVMDMEGNLARFNREGDNTLSDAYAEANAFDSVIVGQLRTPGNGFADGDWYYAPHQHTGVNTINGAKVDVAGGLIGEHDTDLCIAR